jgi:hypothetical protein
MTQYLLAVHHSPDAQPPAPGGGLHPPEIATVAYAAATDPGPRNDELPLDRDVIVSPKEAMRLRAAGGLLRRVSYRGRT